MHKFAYTLTASFGAGPSAPTQVPVMKNALLSLSETLLIKGAGPAYYRNVVLASRQDGSLALVTAERRTLAHVHNVKVVLHHPAPVQASVHVSGRMTAGSVALEAPLVTRIGKAFVIALTESPHHPRARRANPATGYAVSIPLDLGELVPGEYTVAVNGMETTFMLPDYN